jgi:hypothetical protein
MRAAKVVFPLELRPSTANTTLGFIPDLAEPS